MRSRWATRVSTGSSGSSDPSGERGWADPALIRPAEVDLLVGDPGKVREKLGWEPSVDFEALVRMMVDPDLERLGA